MGFLYPSTLVEMMEAGIAVGLQYAEELAQMLFRMFALAIFRVYEPHRGSS